MSKPLAAVIIAITLGAAAPVSPGAQSPPPSSAPAPAPVPVPAPAPASRSAATTRSAGIAPDLSTPKAAARSLFMAISAGDRAAVRAAFFAAAPAQRELADAMADFIVSGKRLGDAARRKFGAAGDPLGRGMLDPADLSKIEAATVKETGDAATLDIPGQTRPMSFRRQDGQWKLVVTDFGGAEPDAIARQTRLVRLMAEATAQSAGEIKAGKFKTPDEAATAIQSRLNSAMVRSYRPTTMRSTTAAAGTTTAPAAAPAPR